MKTVSKTSRRQAHGALLVLAVIGATLAAASMTATPAQARAVDPRCAMFGDDMSDPANIIMRRRCAGFNARVRHPAHNPFGKGPGQVDLVPGAGQQLTYGPAAPARSDRCQQGFVWREARPGDHACVPPSYRLGETINGVWRRIR
jgi:hypothetical protein